MGALAPWLTDAVVCVVLWPYGYCGFCGTMICVVHRGHGLCGTMVWHCDSWAPWLKGAMTHGSQMQWLVWCCGLVDAWLMGAMLCVAMWSVGYLLIQHVFLHTSLHMSSPVVKNLIIKTYI